jgi:mono/diheme cytochrome c family protein
MGFFVPLLSQSHLLDIVGGRAWIEERDQDVRIWIESLKAPIYPRPIDTVLAEEGARLFHEKDLWGPDLANSYPKPAGGNGSCASCHGVYSPIYALAPAWLDAPALEGIASYVVPLDVIGTDPARANSLNDGLKETLKWSWWAYGTNETPGKCFGAAEGGGYLAPPLYGIWASAPYFHNASVPNVWEVLQPSDRREIWRRVSAPPPSSDARAFMGYDTNLGRAYDHEKLGWRYDALECGNPLLEPALDCTPGAAEMSPAGSLWFTWNLETPPLDAAALESRKIYNTHKYSQGNEGHAFTKVLTDAERWALIEYLKTL